MSLQRLFRPLAFFLLIVLWRCMNTPSLENVSATHPVRTTGASYYVALTGDDGNPGTLAQPWRTIQHAADSVSAGDTVFVREGVYNEAVFIEVSGSVEGGYITFQSYPGEMAVLDGTGFNSVDGDVGLYIENQSYLIISGLEIRNFATTTSNAVPMGIGVFGTSHHIQLLNNEIHHIETHAPLDADLLGADAHGIAVYGTTEPASIHDILIDHNHLHHLVLGSSEALVVNGNVEDFTISNNTVHDTNNIGIVMIGFEDTAPDPDYDRARDGVVAGNTVYNVDSLNNPSYAGERSADGIYVDGGTRILIERNVVYQANLGMEVTSEHGNGDASFVTVQNNVLFHNHITGLGLGGYDPQRGSTHDCTFVNNTFFENDTMQSGSGELLLQFNVHDNIIQNNIFVANTQSWLITNPYTENQNNLVDYNLYDAPAGAADSEWQWKNLFYQGFDAYRTGTGNDAHSLFLPAQFADPGTNDFHLLETSPARDAGNCTHAAASDFDSDPRPQGAGCDMGADEFVVSQAFDQYIFIPLVEN